MRGSNQGEILGQREKGWVSFLLRFTSYFSQGVVLWGICCGGTNPSVCFVIYSMFLYSFWLSHRRYTHILAKRYALGSLASDPILASFIHAFVQLRKDHSLPAVCGAVW